MLLPFEGKTIIEKVVENILLSGIFQIRVVLGSDYSEIAEALKSWPVSFIRNEKYWEGMHSSVMYGVSSLPLSTHAVLIFLGDQPFIPSKVTEKVVEGWKSSAKGIVIPLFEGKRGHPCLYDMKYRNQLSNLNPEIGLKSIALTFSEDICEVETFSPEIVRDIDTKEDYYKEIGMI